MVTNTDWLEEIDRQRQEDKKIEYKILEQNKRQTLLSPKPKRKKLIGEENREEFRQYFQAKAMKKENKDRDTQKR